MTDLIARLEAAEAGSRELDEKINDALCSAKTRICIAGLPDEQGGMWMYEFPGHSASSALRVTQSLDAALALAERVLPGFGWGAVQGSGERAKANVTPANADHGFTATAATPALALCAAILRAHLEARI